jgi:histidinol dehydrogenase
MPSSAPLLPILPVAESRRVLDRSTQFADGVEEKVRGILEAVRRHGDEAVADYTRTFDGRAPRDDGGYELPRAEWNRRADAVAAGVIEALELAAERDRKSVV